MSAKCKQTYYISFFLLHLLYIINDIFVNNVFLQTIKYNLSEKLYLCAKLVHI